MARDSQMRKRIFFTHSDPHGAAPSHGRFLTGMPDDDLLQRPIVASEGGGGEISPCCRCEIQGFSRRGCRPTPTLNDPSVRLRPRPNPLFCLSFWVWRMLYSMISSTMSSTQKTCQSRGPLPLCQILFSRHRHQDSEGVVCMCSCVGVCVCVCVCVCVRARDADMCS
jgi:hypothetical protein